MAALIGALALLLHRSLAQKREATAEDPELDREIDRLFVRLWTRATHQDGYDKDEWSNMRSLLLQKGVRM